MERDRDTRARTYTHMGASRSSRGAARLSEEPLNNSVRKSDAFFFLLLLAACIVFRSGFQELGAGFAPNAGSYYALESYFVAGYSVIILGISGPSAGSMVS